MLSSKVNRELVGLVAGRGAYRRTILRVIESIEDSIQMMSVMSPSILANMLI